MAVWQGTNMAQSEQRQIQQDRRIAELEQARDMAIAPTVLPISTLYDLASSMLVVERSTTLATL